MPGVGFELNQPNIRKTDDSKRLRVRDMQDRRSDTLSAMLLHKADALLFNLAFSSLFPCIFVKK
jgi:hypothetical protein